jgi:hypothetical protein
VACAGRDTALDLAELDLINGMTPVALELHGVRFGLEHILRLMVKRWEGQRVG